MARRQDWQRIGEGPLPIFGSQQAALTANVIAKKKQVLMNFPIKQDNP